MSQEKVREILSHVDMTKIDLSSFRISEKKFNELATVYRNRLIISCMGIILEKDKCSQQEVDDAFTILKDITADPTRYEYAAVYSGARQTTDKVLDDMRLDRSREVNGIKVKSIDNCVKTKYKSMRSSIEQALAVGITFEEEFNEELVDRCLRIATKAIDDGYRKANEVHEQEKAVPAEPVFLPDPEPIEVPVQEAVEAPQTVNLTNVESNVDMTNEPTEKPKTSFWKRLFCKA